MPKPLNLFLRPPYDAWTLKCGYGQPMPTDLGASPNETAVHIFLETRDANTKVFTGMAGVLTTRYPGRTVAEPQEELPPPDLDEPVPETVTLFLEPGPAVLDPILRSRMEGLLTASAGEPRARLVSLVYLNMDTASLKNNLLELVTHAMLPASSLPSDVENAWRLFLAGDLDVLVPGGLLLGRPGLAAPPGITPDTRRMGFTVLMNHGTHDPSHFYDWVRDFVEEETAVDAFMGLVPANWPLIDSTLTTAQKIALTQQKLFPFSELLTLQNDSGMSAEQWRQVRNHQKALYRRRLLERVGHASMPGSDPVFEFNDLDWRNPFQLEAIVEFYANFDEPWGNDPPLDPSDTNYKEVDLQPLAGAAAQAAGAQIILDGSGDLNRIWVGRDFIRFETATPTNHRVLRVDAANRVLTVEKPPSAGNDLPWRIIGRPTLVLIDSFGERFGSTGATRTAPLTLRLADPCSRRVRNHLRKVNPRLDTIYLQGDSSANRAYRITGVDRNNCVVTVDRDPQLNNGDSTWQIPAGVGGKLPSPPDYRLGRDEQHGWDHYDGYLFIVYHGRVVDRFRWSSFTAHYHSYLQDESANRRRQARSSIRGNARYLLRSYRSGSAFKNFSFVVADPEAYLTGSAATEVSHTNSRTTIQLDGTLDLGLVTAGDRIYLYSDRNSPIQSYGLRTPTAAMRNQQHVTLNGRPDLAGGSSAWRIQLYDGVRNGRFYYENPVAEDRAPAGQAPGGLGKGTIRLHMGNRRSSYSGSEGCLVSRYYIDMRNRLVDYYRNEHRLLHGADAVDDDMEILADADQGWSQSLWNSGMDYTTWNDKIVGDLWLIRPDEPPLS